MDEVPQEEKNSEHEAEKSHNSIKNDEIQNQEINEEIIEMKENENQMNNSNNENAEIMDDKIENNLSEINNKNEENDSLLQKEINDINIKEENEKETNNKDEEKKISKKVKEKKIKSEKKQKKEKFDNKKNIKSNKEKEVDIIYSHNHFHNENILNYIKQKELKEISECSFKPKINKKIGFEVNKITNKEVKEGNESNKNQDVVERLLLWNERVKQKLNNIKEKKDKEEIERDKCTFFPKLKPEAPKFDKKEISGNEKYYNRIKNSREIQKQKENKLNPNYDELYNKYYKNKEKTVLQKNKKLSKKTYQNYLNHFHNVLMNDDD